MPHPTRLLPLLFLSLASPLLAQDAPLSPSQPLVLLDESHLRLTRLRLSHNDPTLRPVYDALLAAADEALTQPPLSVTEKKKAPPGGTLHDYTSRGPYWWPDPSKPDGLPYVQRDGVRNPEYASPDLSDYPRLQKLTAAVQSLGFAYYFSGNEKYADHAAALLRAWFIAPETRMAPNLNYAQAIPGITDGRGIGIIDTVILLKSIDAIAMIERSKTWTPADHQALHDWFAAYLQWLQTSKNGTDEHNAKNNHGTWHAAQVAGIAAYLGDDALVRKTVEQAKDRIAKQIEPDGRQPLELARTRPFHYSVFNLEALYTLATLGQGRGVDLWHYATPDGRSIRAATDYLAAYADPNKEWPLKDLDNVPREQLFPILLRARIAYGDPAYLGKIPSLPHDKIATSRDLLLWPTP